MPVYRKLALQALILLATSTALPIYAFFPESTVSHLPPASPVDARPRILFLAVFGVSLQVLTSTIHLFTVVLRIRREPLSEEQAWNLIQNEAFASAVGLGTGTLSIAVALGFFLVGLFGGIDDYIAASGVNPLAGFAIPVTLGQVATFSFVAGIVLFTVSRVVALELDRAYRRHGYGGYL